MTVNWLFDAVTAFLLALIPLYFIELRRRVSRGKIPDPSFHLTAAFLLGCGWLLMFYGSFIEPRFLTVKRYAITAGHGGGQIKIALVSDPHLGAYKGRVWAEKVVQRTNDLDADVVILAGDLVSNAAGLEALDAFRDLKCRQACYAVLGNYDYRVGGVDVRKRLEATGVEVLTNESVPLELGGGRQARLIGLDDFWFGDPDWVEALAEVPPGMPTILAVHNPDFAMQAEAEHLDLTLAGHTHGGQIRIPGFGAVIPPSTFLGRRFDQGLFDYGPMKLFITPGVGESGPRARLFRPPEIDLLEISF